MPDAETQQELSSSASPEKTAAEGYIGSVAFYKHLILTLVFLIPTLLAAAVIVLACRFVILKKEYTDLGGQLRTTARVLEEYENLPEAAGAGTGPESGAPQGENALILKMAEETRPQEEGEASESVKGEKGSEEAEKPVESKEPKNAEAAKEPMDAENQEETKESAEKGKKQKLPFRAFASDWRYLLVNEKTPLSQDYEPQLVQTRNGQYVDRRIRADLERMLDDAAKAGHRLVLCSSFRDYEKQDALQDESIAAYLEQGYSYRDAFFQTKKSLALTGASEHHTGLAVDIVGVEYQSLDRYQGSRPEAEWLREHCAEYGFIVRYLDDKEPITGIEGESWHFRYVGKEAAAYITENHLCLEEFVEILKGQA